MPTPVVSARGLGVSFGSVAVLVDVDLDLPPGAALCLTGANGAGKSTLLRCVTGLLTPQAGTVSVFGATPDGSATFWRRVATTVEQPTWYLGLTVREHVELVRLAGGGDPADGHVDELFAVLGLAALADATPDVLSSGQRQRMLLAAVLARPSDLLVLDEPEQRLDTEIRPVVAGLLRDHLAGGGSLLLASHDPSFVAALGCPTLRLGADAS
ncbi:ABC transporter ATP-binding protein [Micromonospora endolithica]|uniref:ABC transporter ATP-binding protein n=1 Tax=Micromonospora endolithica TaxID=230091 RepID=A0A3A9ZSZ1_9ACTN|nr:ABC transporter ATP-binding protein [Micromonospora endolithica]RKN51349.1 ABC transporter ATP-binding protein [Micromonospora endolithica]TWJ20166.1 ABC transporter family protein [Micromonospora endolithica]